jgi:hypothetical protein
MNDPGLEEIADESPASDPPPAAGDSARTEADRRARERTLPAGPGVRPDPLFHRTILLLCLAIVVLSVVLSVRDRQRVLVPVLGTPLPELCMMKRYTGHGCPGCGMTRCFISLGHGDLAAAWSYNPAGLWFFAIVLFQIPYRAAQLWRIRRGLPELRVGWLAQISLGILAVAMIGQWLLKVCGVSF